MLPYLVLIYFEMLRTVESTSLVGDLIWRVCSFLWNVFSSNYNISVVHSGSAVTVWHIKPFVSWCKCKFSLLASDFIYVSLWPSYPLSLSLFFHFSLHKKPLGTLIWSVFHPFLLFWFTGSGAGSGGLHIYETVHPGGFCSGDPQTHHSGALKDIDLETEVPRAPSVGLSHMSNTSYTHNIYYHNSRVNKNINFPLGLCQVSLSLYVLSAWSFHFYLQSFSPFSTRFSSHSDLLLSLYVETRNKAI